MTQLRMKESFANDRHAFGIDRMGLLWVLVPILLLLGICGVHSGYGSSLGPLMARTPITGVAGCCAYTARGKATAAPPPSSVMNSRRFMQPAQPVCRTLSLSRV